jgi:hypothetical protein
MPLEKPIGPWMITALDDGNQEQWHKENEQQ